VIQPVVIIASAVMAGLLAATVRAVPEYVELMRIATQAQTPAQGLRQIRNGYRYFATRFVNQYLITRFPSGGRTWGKGVAFAALGMAPAGPSGQVQNLQISAVPRKLGPLLVTG